MTKHTVVGTGASFEEAVERANALCDPILARDGMLHMVEETPFVTCVDGEHVTYHFFVTLLVSDGPLRPPGQPVVEPRRERPSRFLGV